MLDTMDFDFVAATLDKYGLSDRFDAKKVLLKMGGRRPGKRCKKGWIAAEKQCSDHKTKDGKLTEEGKYSAQELADKVRKRKGMQGTSEVKFARSNIDKALGPLVASGAVSPKAFKEIKSRHKEERSELNKRRINGGRAAIVDPAKASGVAPISKARESRNMNQSTAKRPVAQLADGSLMMRRHSERQAKAQAKVFFPQGFDLANVPESWEGKTFIPAHWLAQQTMANAPVRIPNQRSSSEPRKRGRSVD